VATSTFQSVRKQIEAGRPDPVYLIIGDDEREKDRVVAAFGRLVEDELRAFNAERIYADQKAAAVVTAEACRVLPMMSDRRLVYLLRAENLFRKRKGKGDEASGAAGEADEAESPLDPLIDYVASPVPETTLVVVATDVNRGTKLGRLLAAQATVVACWGLKGEKEVKGRDLPAVKKRAVAWIRQTLEDDGLGIEAAAASLLADRAGSDMARLRNDLERLALFVSGRATISLQDVQAIVGPESLQDHWALTDAIAQGRVGEALRQLALAFEAGAVAYQLLGQLRWVAESKLPPARVPAAVEALLRTDLALKSSGGDPRVLLERLVVDLCGGPNARPPAGPARGDAGGWRRP
jgi:DNA polymerase III subunit delta